MRFALALAVLLAGCSVVAPPRPVDLVREALVALPPDAVRPLLAEQLAAYPAQIDGVGEAGAPGHAARFTVTTAPFGDGGTRVRIGRRALPASPAPTPGEVVEELHARLRERAVRVHSVPVWTDSLSLADDLCPPLGEALFDPPAERSAELGEGDSHPELIGGLAGLGARVGYPDGMRKAGVEGTVVMAFIVEPDGTVGCVQAVESPAVRLSEAAGRAVRASRFTPGLRDGEPVRVSFSMPVVFALR